MHISDQVKNELVNHGWSVKTIDGVMMARKIIEGFEAAGMLSNGTRVVTLEINETGRWLSRVDGWGTVQTDVDLREVCSAAEAIEKVLS